MMYPLEDTITATASAHSLNGLRGIVRLSGEASFNALKALGVSVPEKVTHAIQFDDEVMFSPGQGSLIDEKIHLPARIYLWPDGHSYTGQASAEIHTLGVLPFLDAVTGALCRETGVRMAQPGEFTLRAFLSGRLDLTQAEAVLGTIDAQNSQKLEVALNQLAGGLAKPLQMLRTQLFDLLGHLEAGFDFADEDIEFISTPEIEHCLTSATDTVSGILRKMRTRSGNEILPRVVLYGAPNIGKSALFNVLTGAENSLVFDQPGTTRDYLCATLNVGNFACQLIDTAGDFQEDDTEKISHLNQKSQEIARLQRNLADIQLYCFDALEFVQLRSEALRILSEKIEKKEDCLFLLMRCDRLPMATRENFEKSLLSGILPSLRRQIVWTSSRLENGTDTLRERLEELLADRAGDESDVVASTQSRCREALFIVQESLERALTLCRSGGFQELVATEIRVALEQIGFMVGTVYTEDILDSIFSKFCVGK